MGGPPSPTPPPGTPDSASTWRTSRPPGSGTGGRWRSRSTGSRRAGGRGRITPSEYANVDPDLAGVLLQIVHEFLQRFHEPLGVGVERGVVGEAAQRPLAAVDPGQERIQAHRSEE